jgi:hypothetical protein
MKFQEAVMIRTRHMILLVLLLAAAAAAQALAVPAASAQSPVPRPEYPRTEFVRVSAGTDMGVFKPLDVLPEAYDYRIYFDPDFKQPTFDRS